MKKIITILVLLLTMLNVSAQREITGDIQFPAYPNTRTTSLIPENILFTDAWGNLYSKEISSLDKTWSAWEQLTFEDPATMTATRFQIRKKGNLVNLECVSLSAVSGFICYLPVEYRPSNTYYGLAQDNTGNTSGMIINGSGGVYVYKTTAKNIMINYYID